MNIAFIGHGYVGLVTAAVFADLGNTVRVVGRTKAKIDKLNSGDPLIYEPGLEEMVKRNLVAKRLMFTLSYKEAVAPSDIVFICVGTPPKQNGEADLSSVFAAAEEVGKNLNGYTVVVTKSTVPPGTNRNVGEILQKVKPSKATYDIASSPEFLREGTGLSDTLHPDRVVIGVESDRARRLLVEVHKPIDGKLVVTTIETAETIKYAANSFLSTKISFANAMAQFSEKVGADVEHVLEGIGLDKRIGRSFLYPGVGYGGSCFPKDVKALIAIADAVRYDFKLLKEVNNINLSARQFFLDKIYRHFGKSLKGKRIAILGLAFKPDTDDMREAPSIPIIEALLEKGVEIVAYDPIAMEKAKGIVGTKVTFVKNAYDAVKNTDCAVIITEWNEFRQLDLEKLGKEMKEKVLFDGRNIYDPKKVQTLGFTYYSIGRV